MGTIFKLREKWLGPSRAWLQSSKEFVLFSLGLAGGVAILGELLLMYDAAHLPLTRW